MRILLLILLFIHFNICAQVENYFNPVFNENQVEHDSFSNNSEFIIDYDTTLSNALEISLINTQKDIDDFQLSINYKGHNVVTIDGYRISFGKKTEYIYRLSDIPKILLTDVNHNGIKDLIVRWYTGGAHCCHAMKIYEVKNDKVLTIFDGSEKNMGENTFKDLDYDGIDEIFAFDDIFVYWDGSYASSPAIGISMKWDGDAYRPKVMGNYSKDSVWLNMNKWSGNVSISTFINFLPIIESEIYHSEYWCPSPKDEWKYQDQLAPPELWLALSNLIEIGQCERINKFAENSWAGSQKDLNLALSKFKSRLKESDYIDFYEIICGEWLNEKL